MSIIYKYQIPINFEFNLDLNSGSKVLSIQNQGDVPFIWILMDKKNPVVTKKFKLFTTGDDISSEEKLLYVGTFQVTRLNKLYVYHVFEVTI